MSDMDAAGMSHIGPKKGIVRERVARAWHAGSDHAADEPFGGPLCNCWQVAGRILPMLAGAWDEASEATGKHIFSGHPGDLPNPYESEEDRHVDQ